MENENQNVEESVVVTNVKQRKTRTPSGISKTQFIEAHNSPDCKTVEDVARKTKMSIQNVQVRASIYRKAGVSLKRLERRNKKRDTKQNTLTTTVMTEQITVPTVSFEKENNYESK